MLREAGVFELIQVLGRSRSVWIEPEPCVASWLALFVVASQASQLDSRVDPELCEHVAEVTVHRVGRHEEPFGDFPVGQAFGHEPGNSDMLAIAGRSPP